MANGGDGDGGEGKAAAPVVLITGCSEGGIGYKYCRAFAALGCRVVATDVPDRVPGLAGLDAADRLPLDVTSDASVAEAVSRVLRNHGCVDMLVNNAGIGCTGPLAELGGGEAVRCAMDVNLLGQLRLAAVHAATDALRLELAPFRVHVVKVVPGAVRSGLGHANSVQLAGTGGDGVAPSRQELGMYREFAAAIEERARASQGSGATEASAFARHVAARVMRSRPPREIVYGSMKL
ncbi:unnamed protein product [Alopecurus aequalis]